VLYDVKTEISRFSTVLFSTTTRILYHRKVKYVFIGAKSLLVGRSESEHFLWVASGHEREEWCATGIYDMRNEMVSYICPAKHVWIERPIGER